MRDKFFKIVIIAIVLLIFISVFIILLLNRKKEAPEAHLDNAKTSFQQEILKAEESIKVIIFLPSDKDELLHPEERKILKTSSLSNQVKQVILEIIKGSEKGNLSPVPSGTKIREVYIHSDGTAYIDLSSEYAIGNLGGSTSEIEAIYTIVNSITFNFPNIKRVRFLIDGMDRETLKGHLCMEKFFLPDYSLIKSE